MTDAFKAIDALARWYVNYDEARFEVLEKLVTDDIVSRSRSDAGTEPSMDPIRSEAIGREAVLRWTREHRLESPYPMRHYITNAYVAAIRDDEIDIEAYLLVTLVQGRTPAPVSSGLLLATVRRVGEEYLLCRKEVVIDSIESTPLHEQRER